MTPSPHPETPPPKPNSPQKTLKKKRRRRKKKFEDEDYEESRGIVNKLMQKYSKKDKPDDETVPNAMLRDGKIVHPTKYIKLMERGKHGQWNRHCALPEAPDNANQCQWICALCQMPACHGDLNDLFGPYYIESDPSLPTPDFLFPSGSRSEHGKSIKLDIYLHNQCALWSRDLYFYGGKFPKLTEKLYEFWSKSCHFCRKRGASIDFDTNKLAHFQCLRNEKYEFNPDFFTISPPSSSFPHLGF